jgi:4-carboxymuconolactone decarboxylase
MTIENRRYHPCSRAEIDAWIAKEKIPTQFLNERFPYHLISLLLNNKPLLNAYVVLGRYIGSNLKLSPRDRELLIIRCSVKLESIYEFSHHQLIARSVGILDKEIEELQLPTPKGMLAVDLALVQACDELIDKTELSEKSFGTLSKHFDTNTILEIISVVSLYQWTAMMLRSFHVTIENVLR